NVMAWGLRWTRSRSPTRRTDIPMTNATHTQAGTSKETYLVPSGSSAAKRGVRGRRPIRSVASFPGPGRPRPGLAYGPCRRSCPPVDWLNRPGDRTPLWRRGWRSPSGGYSPPKGAILACGSLEGADQARAGGAAHDGGGGGAEPEPLPAGEALGPQHDELGPRRLEVLEDLRRGLALGHHDFDRFHVAVEGLRCLGCPLLGVGAAVFHGQDRHPAGLRQRQADEGADRAH